ncbi:unnamed protein product, partial [Discosporangium mesarthrocarpum]
MGSEARAGVAAEAGVAGEGEGGAAVLVPGAAPYHSGRSSSIMKWDKPTSSPSSNPGRAASPSPGDTRGASAAALGDMPEEKRSRLMAGDVEGGIRSEEEEKVGSGQVTE